MPSQDGETAHYKVARIPAVWNKHRSAEVSAATSSLTSSKLQKGEPDSLHGTIKGVAAASFQIGSVREGNIGLCLVSVEWR